LLGGAGGHFIDEYRSNYLNAQRSKSLFEKRKADWLLLRQTLADEISRFNGEAGIVVKDLEMNWEISFNKVKLFPSASLTKIPLMAACFLAADQGRVNLDRNIALKSADKLTGSGVLKDMPAGTTFSVERLIGLMIYDSDNTATNIVTNVVGIDYLNSTFKGFGLKNTNLSRKIADYQSRGKGIENYTTAEDMALLLEKIYRRDLGNKNVSDQCINMLKLTRMNDRIAKYLPADVTIAHKTGLEKGVCHDVGIVFTKKGDFIVCVLTKHANSNSMSSKDFIAKIALQMYSYLYDRP
jgi:beta-lactamase class A